MLAFQFAYIVANGLSYGLVLRRMRVFGSERGIFLFQSCSFSMLVCITALISIHSLPLSTSGLFILSAVSLHGIYSLSFLEVWSLSEGSYSISILRHIISTNGKVGFEDLEHLGAIAIRKDENRHSGLCSLGLIRKTGPGHFVTTNSGYVLACIFRLILAFSSGESLNK
jgi:hypothetical protein